MVMTSAFLAAALIAACNLPDSVSGHKDPTRRALSIDQRKLFALNAKRGLEECGSSTNCSTRRVKAILEPEVTYGPYYVLGERIRTDMTEDQDGVPMIIDVQVIDVSNCEPVSDMYVNFWHANATGVYSGVVAEGNGDNSDTSNLNATLLRGVAKTDEDGVAQMTSIFPGHYEGRATHLHFIGKYGGTEQGNATYSGGSVAHVGQFFFDQTLISAVDKIPPYSTNTQSVTQNAVDKWLIAAAEEDYDPIMNYALLGATEADGLFVWISLAVNMSAAQEVQEAAILTANGGVISSNSVLGGGGGSGFGGSKPDGSFPDAPDTSSSTSSSGTSSTTTTASSASAVSVSLAVAMLMLSAFAPLVLGML
ncbi:hypothetical protein PHYSODRAFT_254076 [Phytophthora sojae]|uniref:Intradiol ring-cleavage dioxygenases domain-containing protein n=1 Tax=Phytophthora sojae (strain P6497) TaxID=1094619 RepID=G5A991_PHYSP|nr:hypothetical protein PHYSODRAFT_254076 [Phytophthora sojae]EGZ08467.1 hypothetical protein PHYSODRAFT_254076 [Phytophthora sojae]|eukprot:XP_009536639.1 hypothetical protein PHYSODRAFT_254076 [Phytophthora sojae]